MQIYMQIASVVMVNSDDAEFENTVIEKFTCGLAI